MVIDPEDMPSMLWRVNLDLVSNYKTILDSLAEIQDKHNIPIGFCFSSSWEGNVEEFKKFIHNNGFKKHSRFHWLTKDISHSQVDDFSSGYVIEETKDIDTFADILRVGFSDFTADIFLKGAYKNIENKARVYYLAKHPETKIAAGCGAVFYHNDYAYMSCLAVKPEFRLKGIARDLVRARIKCLQDNKAKYIVTAVDETNVGSLSVQKKSGYVPCDITEYWMK